MYIGVDKLHLLGHMWPAACFVRQVLLEHSCAQSLYYHVSLISCWNSGDE